MRFSLEGVGDVEVTPGATLAECGPGLAALLGPAAGAPLAVEGVRLAPDQVAGVAPWRAGCHVTVGAGPEPVPPGAARDPAAVADGAAWHVAVVAGPDAGALGVPDARGELLVGRGPGAGLGLTDPAVSRRHAVLRSGRGRVRVRDAGSANGTAALRRGRWRRARRVPLPAGARLRLGDTVLEVRRDVPEPAPPAPAPDAGAAPADGPSGSGGSGRRSPRGSPGPGRREPVLALLLPLALAAALALATRSPVFLLMAAAGPLTALATAASGRPRRAGRRGTGHRTRVDRVGAARAAGRRPARAAGPAADLAPDAAAAAVLLARGSTSLPAWWPLACEGLAVVGEAGARRAVARALVGAAVLDPAVTLSVLHPPAAEPHWRWARWLEDRLGGAADARVAARRGALAGAGTRLVISDGLGPWRADLERWWLRSAGGRRAAVVLDDRPPAWCRWRLTLVPGEEARLAGPAGARTVAPPLASVAWAESHARRVAARDAGGAPGPPSPPGPPGSSTAGTGAGLPTRVAPTDVGLPADVAGVVAAWGGAEAGRRRLPGLRVPIGVGLGSAGPEPAWLDLIADGPHGLVAGTTGAGKSELLQALVLGLALRHPPAELAIVLLDFKGGAGLRPCRALPHVAGQVTDLDAEHAVRALEALTAELRRREATLAAAGVADVEALRGRPATGSTAPPRMLVVVDEFRALAEDLPDFVPALVRLAAQGRSLGMHLVLATQRPGGAVTAQMRANLALRVCLRVTEAGDSADVVDVPDAARIPAGAPGRAVVRRADGAPQLVQAVWPALRASAAPLRRARPWADFGTGHRGVDRDASAAHADALADLAVRAADRLALPRAAPLWSPPLPASLHAAELAPPPGEASACALRLGATDPAGAGGRGVLDWDARGLLLVAGAARSGRTTAAATAAAAAMAAGRHVHAVGPVGGLLPAGHPALGTVVDAADPRRLTRLLTLLLARDGREPPCVLVVDDVAAAVAAGDAMPRGAGSGLLERLAREGARLGVGVLATGHPRDVSRLAPLAVTRLVLPVADPADDAALGVPRALGGRRLPGRGVAVAGATAVRCHVALPLGPADLDVRPGASPPPAPAPVRLAALPERVAWPDARPGPRTAPGGPHAVVGLGGDVAGPVLVPPWPGVLVVGPPGSGRSTALATLAGGWAAAGARVAVARSAAAALALARAPGQLDVLVVDDLDLLARTSPELDDALAAWVVAAEAGEATGPTVVAACRTDRAAAAYRGACAALRGAATVLVLAPGEPGSADVAGADVAPAVDPARPRLPGRGVVVARGRATPVQVALVGR